MKTTWYRRFVSLLLATLIWCSSTGVTWYHLACYCRDTHISSLTYPTDACSTATVQKDVTTTSCTQGVASSSKRACCAPKGDKHSNEKGSCCPIKIEFKKLDTQFITQKNTEISGWDIAPFIEPIVFSIYRSAFRAGNERGSEVDFLTNYHAPPRLDFGFVLRQRLQSFLC
jgi:hypothetical protein